MASLDTKTDDEVKANTTDASPASPADSSSAPPADKAADAPQETLLDAVTKAIKPAIEDAPAPSDTETKEDEKAQGAAEAKPEGDPTEDELKAMPERTQKRIRDLLGARTEARKAAEAANARLVELEPKAKSFEQIQTFMRDAELSPNEVSEGFELMRLMKHDPHAALEALRPYYDGLLQATGGVLSPELQAAVDRGELSEAYATQLQKSQSRATQAQAQQERIAAKMQQSAAQQSQAGVEQARQAAWTSWVLVQRGADPDFAAMEDFIRAEVAAKFGRDGIPSTDQLARVFDESKQQIVNRLKRFRPSKPSIDPARPSQEKSVPAGEPKTMLEAVRASIAAG